MADVRPGADRQGQPARAYPQGRGAHPQLWLIFAYLTSRYFGLKAYGGIYSLFFAASNLGIGLGVLTMGVVHDRTGSYHAAAFIFGAALIVAFVLIASLGPYAYASRKVLAALKEMQPPPKDAVAT